MNNTYRNNYLANYRSSAYARGQIGQVSAFSRGKSYYPAEQKATGPSFFCKVKNGLVALLNGTGSATTEGAV